MGGLLRWLADSGVVQGVIIGATFAYLTTILLLNAVARSETTTVNGWRAIRRAGRPGTGLLVRAALQKALPVVNSFEEAAYWTADTDAAGSRLSGDRAYRVRFPADGLPPNGAFWSLTATDPTGYIVDTPGGRSSIGSRSGLRMQPDGSVEILLQARQPPDATPNWLASPSGRFSLMLRAYLPGPAILDGDYELPPVVEVRP
ncbi:DUF1214 domain-containing protein [Leifsonia sp. EB34]|uniref:DUF1214 domain-containing protein n=1 Tax=Leifsonia sp. EB34 TaxID=3156303 RepID=UPI0035167008